MASELENYVKSSRASGMSDQQIQQVLAQKGWGQGDINAALGLPPAPMPANTLAATSSFSMSNFLDAKTKEIIIWSAVGYFCRELIIKLSLAIFAALFAPSVGVYGYKLPVGLGGFHLNFFSLIISSLIFGAIFGVVLAKLYPQIQKINQTYFKGWFNTLYKLIFYPSVIGGLLALIFAGGFSFTFFGTGLGSYLFISAIISVVATIIGSYIYAKLMVSKVGKYYQ